MLRDINYSWHILTQAIIVLAIKTIQNEHVFSCETTYKIINDSLFIPKEHKFIFAKGLYYFLKLEIMGAVSLLVP
jgi:hypothetical protein